MRIRATLVAVIGGALALTDCGGRSSSEPDQKVGKGGTGAHAGAGGTGRAGSAGCVDCGAGESGVGGTTGAGAGGSSGGAGKAAAGGSSGDAGAASGTGGSAAGRGGAGGVGASAGVDGGRGGGGGGGQTGAGKGGDVAAGAGGEAASDGVTIHKVAVYQAVEIPLMVDGDERAPNDNAPLVAERSALLRVWLEPGASFAARELTIEVNLTSPAGNRTASTTRLVSSASTDDDLKSTVNVDILAEEVASASTVSVVVREASAAPDSIARWPATGSRVLEAQSSDGPFLVTLVPLVANGFTPDTSETNRVRYERYLSQLYPATTADVTVTTPLVLDETVNPDGTGWDEALDQLLDLRDADNVDGNVYYYGVLTPGATFDAYCQGDCVVGLSNVAGRTQEQYRGSIGTGYFATSKDTFSQETMAHELGHALGREHSPCGTDDAERQFPYRDGSIGVFGYNGTRLFDPASVMDVMGYCVPVWISDYTYDHLFERIVYVNGTAARVGAKLSTVKQAHRTLRVGIDGRLSWGRERAVAPAEDVQTASIDLLDANGRVVGSASVGFAPLDHLPGGSLSIPSALLQNPDVARVRVGSRVIDVH